jgi:hypothetical protein
LRYYGERSIPRNLLRYRNWKGSQIENRFSHWIWRAGILTPADQFLHHAAAYLIKQLEDHFRYVIGKDYR